MRAKITSRGCAKVARAAANWLAFITSDLVIQMHASGHMTSFPGGRFVE